MLSPRRGERGQTNVEVLLALGLLVTRDAAVSSTDEGFNLPVQALSELLHRNTGIGRHSYSRNDWCDVEHGDAILHLQLAFGLEVR